MEEWKTEAEELYKGISTIFLELDVDGPIEEREKLLEQLQEYAQKMETFYKEHDLANLHADEVTRETGVKSEEALETTIQVNKFKETLGEIQELTEALQEFIKEQYEQSYEGDNITTYFDDEAIHVLDGAEEVLAEGSIPEEEKIEGNKPLEEFDSAKDLEKEEVAEPLPIVEETVLQKENRTGPANISYGAEGELFGELEAKSQKRSSLDDLPQFFGETILNEEPHNSEPEEVSVEKEDTIEEPNGLFGKKVEDTYLEVATGTVEAREADMRDGMRAILQNNSTYEYKTAELMGKMKQALGVKENNTVIDEKQIDYEEEKEK